MAKLLEDRTDNDIKNKWYSMYRSGKVQHARKGSAVIQQSTEQAVSTSPNSNQTVPVSQAPEFPPALSLAPILVATGSNGTAADVPSNELDNAAGATITFACSWGDLTF